MTAGSGDALALRVALSDAAGNACDGGGSGGGDDGVYAVTLNGTRWAVDEHGQVRRASVLMCFVCSAHRYTCLTPIACSQAAVEVPIPDEAGAADHTFVVQRCAQAGGRRAAAAAASSWADVFSFPIRVRAVPGSGPTSLRLAPQPEGGRLRVVAGKPVCFGRAVVTAADGGAPAPAPRAGAITLRPSQPAAADGSPAPPLPALASAHVPLSSAVSASGAVYACPPAESGGAFLAPHAAGRYELSLSAGRRAAASFRLDVLPDTSFVCLSFADRSQLRPSVAAAPAAGGGPPLFTPRLDFAASDLLGNRIARPQDVVHANDSASRCSRALCYSALMRMPFQWRWCMSGSRRRRTAIQRRHFPWTGA